jgi:hypothetical protein
VRVGWVKRYVNRLGRVLDVRRIQQERARADVLQARTAAGIAELTERQRASTYRAHSDPIGPVPYVHHRMDRGLYELRGLALLDATERVGEARRQVQDRLVDWSEAARRVEALERLDGRRRQEHRHELDRDAEREVDDLVTGRFERGADRHHSTDEFSGGETP